MKKICPGCGKYKNVDSGVCKICQNRERREKNRAMIFEVIGEVIREKEEVIKKIYGG